MRCDGLTLKIMGIFAMCTNLVFATREWPPGLNAKIVPAMTFDDDAPICNNREACGFYSFTLRSRTLRWIKSWCRCGSEHECVYEKTDLKMRVYRQVCVPQITPRTDVEKEKQPNEDQKQLAQDQKQHNQDQKELAQEHQHLLAARSRRAFRFLHIIQMQ